MTVAVAITIIFTFTFITHKIFTRESINSRIQLDLNMYNKNEID